MKYLETIHGLFVDEASYFTWCNVTGNKPEVFKEQKKKENNIMMVNDYDLEKRRRKNDSNKD